MWWLTVAAIGGKLWDGFCKLISTPIGAALLAALIAFGAGVWHEHGKLVEAVAAKDTEWRTKWADAEKQAELDRQKRDAFITAKMAADANEKLKTIGARKDELEQQVNAYETQQLLETATKKPACPPEYTDAADARWLRDQRAARRAKPEAKRGFALRLRALDR